MSVNLTAADILMQQAVTDRIFPGGVLLVSKLGRILFCKPYGVTNLFTGRPVSPETVFDLASLTKPLATTLAIMLLIQRQRLFLSDTMGVSLPPFAASSKSAVTIQHLLNHTSGLPDYRDYFRTLVLLPTTERADALKDLLVREPLVNPIGEQTVYSDLGFMTLQWVVEAISGRRMDRFLTEYVYDPLGLRGLFFIDLFSAAGKDEKRFFFAATEQCPWRETVLEGVVHDDNAYAMGGIAGHAGLFGTAMNVHALLSELLSCFSGGENSGIFQPEVVRMFLAPPSDGKRPLGFDRPSERNSSSGHYFSAMTVGHLGFTGTSFWMDLEKGVIVLLLTNRIHPSRNSEGIKTFRPILHDAVMKIV